MNEESNMIAELERRWPGKWLDDELTDLAPRLARYHRDDAVRAMEIHKDRSRFRPSWAELLAQLNVLVRSNSAALPAAPRPEPTFPQLLAAQLGAPPAVAVLIYWRGVWTHYAIDAVDRRQGMPDSPERRNMLRMFNGMKTKCCRGAVAGLVAAGADLKWAEATGELVTAEQMTFDRAVHGIEVNGFPQPDSRQKATTIRQPIYGDIFESVPDLVDPAAKHRQVQRLESIPIDARSRGDGHRVASRAGSIAIREAGRRSA